MLQLNNMYKIYDFGREFFDNQDCALILGEKMAKTGCMLNKFERGTVAVHTVQTLSSS